MINYQYQDNLESERLKTRFLNLDDVSIWSKFFEEKETQDFLPSFEMKLPEEKSKFWIEKQLWRYSERRFGHQALIEKKTGNFIGQCGLLLQEVNGILEVEVGYHVFKRYWGQGFAPEAARLFIQYAFDKNICDSVISIIHKDNLKSQRVAQKNGLILEESTDWNGLEVHIYRIKKENWS